MPQTDEADGVLNASCSRAALQYIRLAQRLSLRAFPKARNGVEYKTGKELTNELAKT